MSRFARVILTVSALSLTLGGCESFDPTAIFDAEIFNTKKKLPGERQPVFPEGTPGVSQGVPPELVKGYQPPPEPEPAAKEATAEPKPKSRPKPKVVAKPKDDSTPTAVTVRPSRAESQPQWPDPPPVQRQQPEAGAWPGSAQPAGQVAWPDPPVPR